MRETRRDGRTGDGASARPPDGPVVEGTASEAHTTFGFGPAPLEDGLVYPGALPRSSYLFTGEAIEAVGTGRPSRAALDGSLDGWLDARLRELGVTPMRRRHPVLAYGSNRAPAQLRAKFADRGVDPVVPVLLAQVVGLSVVHAAAVARYGAVPASLVDEVGAATEVAVTFLDDEQLALVDATEPGHDRVLLDPERYPLRFVDDEAGGSDAAGAARSSCRCYWSRRAVLTVEGAPVRLAAVESSASALVARSQTEVHALLLEVWAAGGRRFGSIEAFVAAVRADRDLHRWVAGVLARLETEPVGELGAVAPRRPGAVRSPPA